jgi:hypothetical protein
MLYGPVPEDVNVGELDNRAWLLPLLVPLSLLILGLTIPAPVTSLLNKITEIVSNDGLLHFTIGALKALRRQDYRRPC